MWLSPGSRIRLAAAPVDMRLGFWLLYRRLDQGRLHWPRIEDGAVELSAAPWALLVEGRPWTPLPALRMCTPTAL